MQQLKEYRKAAIGYLYSRVAAFSEEVDELLDSALRQVSKLPPKPKGDDQYNGTLGMKPVVEQRKLCLRLLLQRLNKNAGVIPVDFQLDKTVRVLNKLPSRPAKNNPYIGLFTLKKKEEYYAEQDFKTSKKGIDLIHSFESYRECTYKDPGTSSGLPITG